MFPSLFTLLLAAAGLFHPADDERSRFLLLRNKALAESSQRHLEYGVRLRRQGLCVQAAEQVVRAVETANGENAGARTVLGSMRDLNDKIWRRRLPKPSRSALDAYAREAHKLDVADENALLEAALWAYKAQIFEEAHAEYLEILERRGEPLEFTSSGSITLGGGTLPEKESERIRGEAISINDRLYVRDRFLAAVPQLKTLFEERDSRLCVRSTRSLEEARTIHALVLQLLPVLEEELGARPTRGLMLVLLDDAASYESYLDAAHMPENKPAFGFADKLSGMAIVCTAKTGAQDLVGVCLHEMAHEYHYSVSRATMPSWYDEGLAESYGGQGVVRVQDGKLAFDGVMPPARLSPLRAPKLAFGLRELLETRAVTLLAQPGDRAHAYYAECWAFVRFLRSGAGDEVASRFEQWENTCRGALVDAQILGLESTSGKAPSASDLFLKSFGRDLPKLEEAFSAWLAKL
ncbi:MAG: hypothetical protein IPJ19_07450 [Planctomycetes bacterium]|nr:hypothetical protein [Planctomycetota bacterium]